MDANMILDFSRLCSNLFPIAFSVLPAESLTVSCIVLMAHTDACRTAVPNDRTNKKFDCRAAQCEETVCGKKREPRQRRVWPVCTSQQNVRFLLPSVLLRSKLENMLALENEMG